MWPVGLSVEMAEQIRTDLRDMARARRIARCVRWLRSALDSNWQQAKEADWYRMHALDRRAQSQRMLIDRLMKQLVDVCHG
jgi:hypothetical protein